MYSQCLCHCLFLYLFDSPYLSPLFVFSLREISTVPVNILILLPSSSRSIDTVTQIMLPVMFQRDASRLENTNLLLYPCLLTRLTT